MSPRQAFLNPPRSSIAPVAKRHDKVSFTSNARQFIMAALAACLLTASASAAGDRLLGLVPSDAEVVIQIPDVPALLAAWEASPLGGFCVNPRAAPFLAPAERTLAPLRRRMARAHGNGLAGGLATLNGEAVVAGLPSEAGADRPLRWLVIFDYDRPGLARDLLEAWDSDPPGAATDGATRVVRETVTLAGHEVMRTRVVHETPAAVPTRAVQSADQIPFGGNAAKHNEAAVPTQARQRTERAHATFVGNGIAVWCDAGDDAMADVLGRLGAPLRPGSFAAALAAKAPGSAGEATRDHAVALWANLEALGRWAAMHPRELGLGAAFDPKALGLEDVGWLGAGLTLSPDRLTLDARVTAHPETQGVARILFFDDGRPADAAAFAPSGTIEYASSFFPLQPAWDTAQRVLHFGSPALGMLVDGQLNAFWQATGLKVREDLLGQLGGHLARFALPGGARGRGTLGHVTWLLDVRDAARFQTTLTALLNYGMERFGAYQVEEGAIAGGGRRWTVREGRPNTGYVGKPLAELALVNGWLAVGPDPDGVAAAAARLADPSQPSLKGTAGFGEAMADLPADRFWEAYASVPGLLRMLADGMVARWGGAQPEVVAHLFDPRALPPADLLDATFGPTTGSRTHTPDGVEMTATLRLRQPKASNAR